MSVAAELEAELDSLGALSLRPFDVHSHTGVDVDGTSRSSEEHLRDLEAVGGRSVVFPFCVESGYAAENRRVVEECDRAPGTLVPFARLDPRADSAPEAEAALEAGARGIKLHPRAESFPLDHPGVDAIFGAAAAARAPVLVHAGTGVGSFGSALTDLAAAHRECPIVLAHAGVSDLASLWRVVPEHPNLFFDTAWLVPADLLALFALVPPGRILFGSDAPLMDFDLVLAVTLRCARFAGLSDEAIDLVAGRQLEALLEGAPPTDAGPAPGPPARVPTPAEARLVSLLSAAGGCLLGGGDTSRALELSLLALEGGEGDELASLIEEARSPGPDAVRAVVLALTRAMTPRAGVEALI